MPVQKNPRLWIAGFSNVAVKRAARVGAGYIAVGPVGPFTQVYRDELARQGKNPMTLKSLQVMRGSTYQENPEKTVERGRGASCVSTERIWKVV